MRRKYIHGVYSARLRRHARFDTLPPHKSHTRTSHPCRTSTEAPAAAPWRQHWDSRGSATTAELSGAAQRCAPGIATRRTEDVGADLAWSASAPRTRHPALAPQLAPRLPAAARTTPPSPRSEIHRRASALSRGAGAGAQHRARGVQQHHRRERGRQEVDPRAAASGASRVRRRIGAGAIFRVQRYSVAWHSATPGLPWRARPAQTWDLAWRQARSPLSIESLEKRVENVKSALDSRADN